MRVLFWCTSFQSDNHALALHLREREGTRVRVLVDGAEARAAELASSPAPYRGEWGERATARSVHEAIAWAPDVMVVDNQLPSRPIAPRSFVLWHGYGWRVDDLRRMKKQLARLVGNTEAPNDAFCWQAFGPIDRGYRIEHSGFDPDNVRALGSAYSDLLLPGSPRRVRPSSSSPVAVRARHGLDPSRKTVLLGFTWHHGAPFEHWGDDAAVFDRLLSHLGRRGVNVVLRMHDRDRYPQSELKRLEALTAAHPGVALCFKDESPDSLPDLLGSAVLISNYSSLLNDFYYTLKPTVHVDPRAGDGSGRYRHRRWGRVWTRREKDGSATWKNSPDDVGGLIARNPDELIGQVDRALDEPGCCRQLALGYLARHVSRPDGHTSERIGDFLSQWVATGLKPGEPLVSEWSAAESGAWPERSM